MARGGTPAPTRAQNKQQGADKAFRWDGQFRQAVNASSATRLAQQAVYRDDGLRPGVHTIRLVKQSGMYMLVAPFTFR